MDSEGNRESSQAYVPTLSPWRAQALGWRVVAFTAGIPPDVPLMAPV